MCVRVCICVYVCVPKGEKKPGSLHITLSLALGWVGFFCFFNISCQFF